ncbi:hypothetical protein [Nitrososphaera viennensis]|uniref:Uncharacterized protein n=2 Tax=Nitrososphaera viennensis TaxID=1034015 RepID=A0A060HQ14_9ARCH|nr:hypothetical protein [Nitrososphaera viennensis]AIC17215.1 hypothetical protein NVIE_029370 [Nitrososphaera viennensis EN76]UVS69102.1 hypothetical protein NWT39_14505 [Nitrososphaera viennensis]
MKVELEMYIDEEDESIVLKNVSEITKHAKELGFKLGELEFKNREYDKREKKEEEKGNKENKKRHHGHHHGR